MGLFFLLLFWVGCFGVFWGECLFWLCFVCGCILVGFCLIGVFCLFSIFKGKAQTMLEWCRSMVIRVGFGPDPARCRVSQL